MDDKMANLGEFIKLEDPGYKSHSNIFKVKNRKSNKYYAASTFRFYSNIDDLIKKFRADLYFYKILSHPALMEFSYYSHTDFRGSDNPVIFTDYMENGSLSNILTNIDQNEIPKGWNNTKMIINILGISLGIKYLHDNQIIHLNLKPSKILLDSNYYPKINYFFTSELINENTELPVLIGTPYYMAPEIIENESVNIKCGIQDFAFKIDVFSFGMILYEFYAHSKPVTEGKRAYHVIKNISDGFRPDNSKLEEGPIKEMIMRCWSEDPDERPSFEEIIENYTMKREIFWPSDV